MRESLSTIEPSLTGWRARTAATDSSAARAAVGTAPARRPLIGGSAWVVSLLLHATLLVWSANWLLQSRTASPGAGSGRHLTMVDRPADASPPVVRVGGPPPPPSAIDAPTEAPAAPPAAAAPSKLPKADAEAPSAPRAGGDGPPASRPGAGGAGAATTGVFGVAGRGFKFIYVFDRSGSMGGSGRTALDAAKSELSASLEHLGAEHEFQIIFYNESPTLVPFADRGRELGAASPQHKQQAARFIAQINPDGATRHEPALRAALALDPDIIFFLTDADQPVLTPTQLAEIHRANHHGSIIHTIEFGFGPAFGGRNFLAELAEQNGGRHQYVDISRLRR
ncbi:MAG: hypothetical protein K1X74_13235 [Pirellulales bacterium]|nr:hypothetical protein [Pirellulales bacterium]